MATMRVSEQTDFTGKRRRASLRVIVLAAVFALVFAVAALALLAKHSAPVVHLTTLLTDASSFRRGSPVTLAGIQVGTIDSIALTDDNRARVVVVIRADVASQLHAASDGAACDRDTSSRACGTQFEATDIPYIANPIRTRALLLKPGENDGPPLADGAFVRCREPSFGALIDMLEDEKVVRDIPRDLGVLLPELLQLTRRLNVLTEGFEHSFAGHLLGAPRDEKKHDAHHHH